MLRDLTAMYCVAGEEGDPMSRPFAIAVFGLILLLVASTLSTLTLGRGPYGKPTVVWSFFIGCSMAVGGLAVGLMRSIREGRRPS